MGINESLDEVYNVVEKPLKNYSSKTNTITGMMQYMKVFGDVMKDFTTKMNEKHRELITKYPNKKESIEQYIAQLKSKLIRTYKPK